MRPLTRQLVERHLDDLAMNKLPKIAKAAGMDKDAAAKLLAMFSFPTKEQQARVAARSRARV